MPDLGYTQDELMTIAAARWLQNDMVCFVGIGIPSAAANLARLTHAPNVVLIYESGTIGTRPEVLPLSIGDGELAETADTVVSVPEIFRYWLQGSRIDVGFLGAAQIDRFANLNSTVIGEYQKPRARLPGAGGAPEIASAAKEVVIVLSQTNKTFVSKIDFITSSGLTKITEDKSGDLKRSYRPRTVVTDMGVMESDAMTGELVLTAVHPEITREQVQAATAWDLRVSVNLAVTPRPSEVELVTLRELKDRTALAHSKTTS